MNGLHFKVFALITCVASVNTGSIGLSDKVNKDINDELFPNWVPFKNKHGDELGEFVQVKSKPRKRLAPPMYFILRSLEEEEFDDRSAGGDNDDYFENKNWSDTDRTANNYSDASLNHTALSDIEGVVSIITTPVTDIFNLKQDRKTIDWFVNNNEQPVQQETNEINKYLKKDKTPPLKKHNKDDKSNSELNYNEDYEEDSDEKKTKLTDEERKQAEEKKAKILSSVDELKERHAAEQRAYNMKEEEFLKERLEGGEYVNRHDKYDDKVGKYTKFFDNKNYESDEIVVSEKYKVRTKEVPPRITIIDTTTESAIIASTEQERGKQMQKENIVTLFKNPLAFMLNENDYDKSTTANRKNPKAFMLNENGNDKSTSATPKNRIAFMLNDNDKSTTAHRKNPIAFMLNKNDKLTTDIRKNNDEHILLVPQDMGNSHSPALFIPQVRKINRQRVKTTTTPAYTTEQYVTAPDSSSAAAVTSPDVAVSDTNTTPTEVESDTTDNTAPSAMESAPSEFESTPSEIEYAPFTSDTTSSYAPSPGLVTGTDTSQAVESNSDGASPSATDAVPASSNHEKEEHDDHKDHHHESGGEQEHQIEHKEEHGEHGKKGYESDHHEENSKKGHHDKHDHLNKYDDHEGMDKRHHNHKQYFGEHHHTEEGKKHAQYEESGKHSKGHSTKGSHDVHKKEEYEKNVEFFEEDGDSGEEEKHGGHNKEKEHKRGGSFKEGNYHHGHTGFLKGETGKYGKRRQNKGLKGHTKHAGHDSHGKKYLSNDNHGGREQEKHWVYHHGHPPRTATFALVDKRADHYINVPYSR